MSNRSIGVPLWSPSPLPHVVSPDKGAQWLVFGGDNAATQGILRRIADDGGRATLVRAGSAFAPAVAVIRPLT